MPFVPPKSPATAHRMFLCGGDATATRAELSAMPEKFNGLPASYYWRRAVKTGTLTHPIHKWVLNVTPERQAEWVDRLQRRRAKGIDVPVYSTHNPKNLPELKVGNVIDARVKDGWYEELHQYLGADAEQTALRNHVSIALDQNVVDAGGEKYGEATVHTAIVPDPVQFGQGEALKAASIGGYSEDDTMKDFLIPAATVATLMAMLGDGVTEDNFLDKLAAAVKPKAAPDVAMSISDETLDTLAEADSATLESLTATGVLTPACSKALGTALLRADDGKPVRLSLTSPAGAKGRLSKAVLDALKLNAAAARVGAPATGNQQANLSVSDGLNATTTAAATATADADFMKERLARIGS